MEQTKTVALILTSQRPMKGKGRGHYRGSSCLTARRLKRSYHSALHISARYSSFNFCGYVTLFSILFWIVFKGFGKGLIKFTLYSRIAFREYTVCILHDVVSFHLNYISSLSWGQREINLLG